LLPAGPARLVRTIGLLRWVSDTLNCSGTQTKFSALLTLITACASPCGKNDDAADHCTLPWLSTVRPAGPLATWYVNGPASSGLVGCTLKLPIAPLFRLM